MAANEGMLPAIETDEIVVVHYSTDSSKDMAVYDVGTLVPRIIEDDSHAESSTANDPVIQPSLYEQYLQIATLIPEIAPEFKQEPKQETVEPSKQATEERLDYCPRYLAYIERRWGANANHTQQDLSPLPTQPTSDDFRKHACTASCEELCLGDPAIRVDIVKSEPEQVCDHFICELIREIKYVLRDLGHDFMIWIAMKYVSCYEKKHRKKAEKARVRLATAESKLTEEQRSQIRTERVRRTLSWIRALREIDRIKARLIIEQPGLEQSQAYDLAFEEYERAEVVRRAQRVPRTVISERERISEKIEVVKQNEDPAWVRRLRAWGFPMASKVVITGRKPLRRSVRMERERRVDTMRGRTIITSTREIFMEEEGSATQSFPEYENVALLTDSEILFQANRGFQDW